MVILFRASDCDKVTKPRKFLLLLWVRIQLGNDALTRQHKTDMLGRPT